MKRRVWDQRKQIRTAAWVVAVVLGFVHAAAGRHTMLPDGVSYLDVADKYLQQDWTWAINAYWSPLYSWLLAGALYLIRPSPYWEYPVVHLVNFLIYVVAFVCFEFLLSQFIRYLRERVYENSPDGSFLPPWCWQALGYVLFLWCALVLITVEVVTPDMCVAALVFMAAGLLIRIRLHPDNWLNFIFLGLVLGVAYLAKQVMFPLAFVFLVVAFFSTGHFRKAAPRLLICAVIFLMVCAPFLWALHKTKGRWTFGDTGPLAYAWIIDDIAPHIHWQGEPAGSGTPAHPTNRILTDPLVYEFKQPLKVTYPPWYDASYWNEGLRGHFNLRGQVKALGSALLQFYAVFINGPIAIATLVGFLVLQLYTDRRIWTWLSRIQTWNLLVPAVAALALYSLVLVEKRYIGPVVVLIWLSLFSGIRLKENGSANRLFTSVVLAMTVTSMVIITATSLVPAYATARDILKREDGSTPIYWQVADGLSAMGVKPGDQVGFIGEGFAAGSYWARLAKIQIIAEITSGSNFAPKQDVEKFWNGTAATKSAVFEAFSKTGAKAIIADREPPGDSLVGWQRIGNTDHYIYFLR
jgi:hypothetical protein